MRALRIKYESEIVTLTCDSIAYIGYNERRNLFIKSSNGSCIADVTFPTAMTREECSGVYLKLCEYVFYGQLEYGENYIITLTSNGVNITVMKANNVLQTNLKET